MSRVLTSRLIHWTFFEFENRNVLFERQLVRSIVNLLKDQVNEVNEVNEVDKVDKVDEVDVDEVDADEVYKLTNPYHVFWFCVKTEFLSTLIQLIQEVESPTPSKATTFGFAVITSKPLVLRRVKIEKKIVEKKKLVAAATAPVATPSADPALNALRQARQRAKDRRGR